ncbi:ferredoxin--NADP reductase [Fusobacterium animalis]|uniref:FAD-dependent oxidoreductase n=1 Tax=Fusobacterium animalis TaxID=76859 RepID=UPI0030CF0770
MKKIYDLSLIERNNVAENTFELIFTKPDDYFFKIGQYIFLDVAHKGENKIARALSIASHPDENILRFVMRISDSDFKTRCLEMKKGDNATITQATGNFGFKFSDKEIVFLISGIGIAPIMPMLMELEKINYQGKVSLFYSNRTLAKTTYHERLQDFNIKNYNYNPVFTGIQPRINIDLLKEKLDDIYNSNYYIIGTSDFIKTMKTLLEENHIDKKNYLVDNFG